MMLPSNSAAGQQYAARASRGRRAGPLACGLAAALWLASGLAIPARAQAPDTVWLEDLTWTELRDAIATGTTTVIIPVGGVEQSGPSIALGKHDVRVRVLAERIARALGHTLVAPVVAYVPEGNIDPPTQHMRFPGTITVPAGVFHGLLESAAGSLRQHGFRDVVLIGDHGGYQADLRAVAEHLNQAWAATPARALFVADYYRASTAGFAAILVARGYSEAEIGTHAGVADTSLAMAVDPRLVRSGVLRAPPSPGDGIAGDPRRSSPDLGRLGVDNIVATTTTAIRAALLRPRHPDLHKQAP